MPKQPLLRGNRRGGGGADDLHRLFQLPEERPDERGYQLLDKKEYPFLEMTLNHRKGQM